MKEKKQLRSIGYVVCGIGLLALCSTGIYCHYSLYNAYNNGNVEKISAYEDYMRGIHPQYETVMFASLLDKAFLFKHEDITTNLKIISYTANNKELTNTKLYRAVEVYLDKKKSKKDYIISLEKSIDTINSYEFFKSRKKMVGVYRASIVDYVGQMMKEGKYSKELVDNYVEVYENQKKNKDYDQEYFYEELFGVRYMLDDLISNNELEGNSNKSYVATKLSEVFSDICTGYSGKMTPYLKKYYSKLQDSLKKLSE